MKSGTIFDSIEKEPLTGKEGFIQSSSKEDEDQGIIGALKSYGKTALKGGIEGLVNLSQMINPQIQFEEEKGFSKAPVSQQTTETLEELLPNEEGFAQRSLRRGLGQLPSSVAFPGSALSSAGRSILAGFFGEGSKELGAPEWAQTAAELTAYIGPDITKKLLEKGSKKEIVQAGRELGLSDEAIAPLMQSNFTQKWLSKLSPKRGKTEKILANTKEELGEAYNRIQKGELAKTKSLSEPSISKVQDSIYKSLKEMPSDVRNKIGKDLDDLIGSNFTGDDLMNFYKDVGHELGPKSKQLSTLKPIIREAIKEINPKLGKDFDNLNLLFSKYYPIQQKLKPDLASDIVSAGKSLATLLGIGLGDTSIIAKAVGSKIAGKLAQNILLKPRYQQLGSKMVDAMNENKWNVVSKLNKILIKDLEKDYPEIANDLKSISDEELKEFFSRP